MKKITKTLFDKVKNIPFRFLCLVTFLGFIVAFFTRNYITAYLFSGKSFDGRNFLYRMIFLLFFTLIFALLLFVTGKLVLQVRWVYQKAIKLDRIIMSQYEKKINNNQKRIWFFVVLVAFATIFIFLCNNVLSSINTKEWSFSYTEDIPLYSPVGMDFRQGLYRPAEQIFLDKTFKEIWNNDINTNSYPPLATSLGLFYLPFGEDTGYLIHVGLLVLANIVNVIIAFMICTKYVLSHIKMDKFSKDLIVATITLCVACLSFSNYPFRFSIERGNIDAIAFCFSLLSIWVLLRNPEKKWAQIILLSIATNLKIYPAILFLVLFKKHGWKMIFPTIVSNVILFFILGPNNAMAFVKTITNAFGAEKHPHAWIGNHSAFSFVSNLQQYIFHGSDEFYSVYVAICLFIPLFFWFFSTVNVFKKPCTPTSIIQYFVLSTPIMCILPTVSHDYKLVILCTVFIILLASIVDQFAQNPTKTDMIQLMGVLILMLFIGRSYVFIDGGANYFIGNKYIWLVSLEILAFWRLLGTQENKQILLNE